MKNTKADKTARFVREARKTLGHRQIDLARLLGVKRPVVAQWENGHTVIPGNHLLELQDLLSRAKK